MHENDIARIVVDVAYHIHKGIGPGLLESVYEAIMVYELEQRGLVVARQVPIPVIYKSMDLGIGFRADIIVQDKLILELKSVETVLRVHKKQLLTYLRLTDKRLGLLINFGENLIKDGITRVANNL